MAAPGGKSVGRVSIRVIPNATKFRNDLKLLLKRVENSMSANLKVGADVSQATADMQRFQRKWNNETVSVKAAVGRASLSKAGASLAALARTRDVRLVPRVAAGAAARAASLLAAFSGARLASDLVQNLGNRLSNLDRALPKIAAVSLSIAGLSSLLFGSVGAVGAVIVALGQLAGAAALIPAAFGSASFAIGTLITSFSGVGSALGEALKPVSGGAVASAASNGRAIESAMRGIERAQRGVITAERSLAQAQVTARAAQESLTKAREDAARANRDLANSLIGARLNERQAILDLAAAQQQYDATQAHPGASREQREQAAITFEQARLALEEQRNRVADLAEEKAEADRAGINGSREVLAANDDITRSQVELQDSQQGVADANQAVVDAQNDLLAIQQQNAAAAAGTASAMSKLTPNAQAAVRALLAVKEQLSGVRRIAQENFFANFSAPLLSLASAIIPQLRSGMGSIATQLGVLFATLMASLESSLGGGVLDGLLQSTAAAVENLLPGIQPIIQALTTLGIVGMQYIPQMSTALAEAASRFNEFIGGAAADGRLNGWIDAALQGFSDVGSILVSTGQILGGLFGNLYDVSALTLLADVLDRMQATINTPVFQSTLQTIFDGAVDGAQGLGLALGPIGNMLTALAPTIAAILSTSGSALGTFFGMVADALSSPVFADGLTMFFSGIQEGLLAIGPALPAIAEMLGSVAGFAGQLAAQLGPVLSVVLAALAPIVMELLSALQPLLPVLGEAFIGIVSALAPVLMEIVTVALPPLIGLFMELVPALLPLVEAILPVLSPLLSVVSTLFSALAPLITTLVTALTPLLELLVTVLEPILTAIEPALLLTGGALEIVAEILGGSLRANLALITGILTGDFSGAIREVQSIWLGVWDSISSAFKSTWNAIAGWAESSTNSMRRLFVDLANGIIGALNGLIDGLNGVASGIRDATGGAIDLRIGHLGRIGYPEAFTMPRLATGADVLPRPGGTPVVLGEAGRRESVVDYGKQNAMLDVATALAERSLAQRSGAAAPLVNELNLLSTGETRNDMELALFMLRVLRNGGLATGAVPPGSRA